jgi:shikimate dehydrogenase
MLNNRTRLNMVIGYPLDHTQSPMLHNSVYNVLNCNTVMLAHSTTCLPSTLTALKTLSVGLTAVTMPFKEDILSYLDNMSEEVKQLKAANTVISHNGKLWGHNTDIDGIAYALRKITLVNKNVLIVGAGGAAHAAAFYLKKNNANIFWLNRTPKRASSAIELFGGKIINLNQLNELSINVIINATSLGMFPNINISPLPNYQFTAEHVIFDMVYNPIETMLLKNARLFGATCISGLDMFIAQGLKQIELWLNKAIITDNMIELIKTKIEKSLDNSEEIA